MTELYFTENINDWDSWSRVYDSTYAFSSLARAIFLKEGLNVEEDIQNLTPGSNAVFKADDLVIKIFTPAESGYNTEYDYLIELSVMKFAMQNEISVPHVIASGEISDKYLFHYIIMKYIPVGVSIDDLLAFPLYKKKDFVKRLKKITKGLHKPFENFPKQMDLKNQDIRAKRMNGLCPKLINELMRCTADQDLSEVVLVHGDITRENLLLGSNGSLTLIDFADSIMAPVYYELPVIIFELFLCDKELSSEFVGEYDKDMFMEELIMGTSIHLFCGNILKDYFKRFGIPIDKIESIDELKQLLRRQLFL